jgi:hypothetical protein
MQAANTHSLSRFVSVPEEQFDNICRARDALDALAVMAGEIANKAMGNPAKDLFMNVPADGFGSLLSCIHASINTANARVMA